MHRYKRKKNKLKRRLIALLVVIALIVGVCSFVSNNVYPIIDTIALEEAKALTMVAVNTAAIDIMGNGNVVYDDIMKIERNTDGEILAMDVDPILVNRLARDVTLVAQSNLANIGVHGVEIPVGTLTGIAFLSGIGPEVNLKIYPVGSVGTRLKSDFESTGINQTKHSIVMVIDAYVSVVIPGMTKTLVVSADVLVCENIIVGKVPNTYLYSANLDEMLNLIP